MLFRSFREVAPSEVELRNYGIRKLEELGFLDIEVIESMFEWLFSQPVSARRTIEEMGENLDDSPQF